MSAHALSGVLSLVLLLIVLDDVLKEVEAGDNVGIKSGDGEFGGGGLE